MKLFDKEVTFFNNNVTFYLKNHYRDPANRLREFNRLHRHYLRISKFPICEITPSVWDRFQVSVEKALIA